MSDLRRPVAILKASDGIAAAEFAMMAPLVLLLLFLVVNLGMLFESYNGVQHAVGEGARLATIYPRPTDSQITSAVQAAEFGLDPSLASAPTYSHGTNSGIAYVDVTLTYNAPVNFPLFSLPAVPLTYTKRAYQQ
ncbi:MAG: hypothetical protein NVSMB69_00980 [Novosphingobium sp.]